MADYSGALSTQILDCTINSLEFKSIGCINSYNSAHLQINGLKIEG